MPTNDERNYYIRNTKVGFQNLLVAQAFFDARPLVKTEATEEEEAVYYTEADGLTFEQAMRLYKPHSVALMKEVDGEAPVNLGTLADHDELPEEMTHVFFALNGPKMGPFEIAALVRQADAVGQPINEVLIPWGTDKTAYLQTGALPE
jgi:hypothetical protein